MEESLTAEQRRAVAGALDLPDVPEKLGSLAGPLIGTRILRFVDLDFVRLVQPSVPARLHNFEGTMFVGRDLIFSQYGYTGSGVNVAIGDSGIDLNHPDFESRIRDRRKFAGSLICGDDGDNVTDNIGHGTHVAGIAAGGEITIVAIAAWHREPPC